MTPGKRKGVDLGKNLISTLWFLKLQMSEVMANYPWDDAFHFFVRFSRIGKDIEKRGERPLGSKSQKSLENQEYTLSPIIMEVENGGPGR